MIFLCVLLMSHHHILSPYSTLVVIFLTFVYVNLTLLVFHQLSSYFVIIGFLLGAHICEPKVSFSFLNYPHCTAPSCYMLCYVYDKLMIFRIFISFQSQALRKILSTQVG